MSWLENKIPPPLIATGCGVAMWGVARVMPTMGLAASFRLSLVLLLAALGAFFCAAGVVSFRRARTTVNPLKPESASSLVSGGIYRISRNPMYLGFAVLLTAWAVWLTSFWALAGVGAFVLYMNRYQIASEERAMAALFGEEFERYRQAVRRWI